MAVYIPPTETLPIFDNAVFPSSTSALTPTTGLSYFLSYPTAQGQETISNLQTTNIIANPTTTGDISVGTSQTSGFIKLGSITRSGIIYLGNVIFQQVSGVLSFSINSFTSLTTLNLFTGSSSGFSSGFTTVNFLQGTLFKNITSNILTSGSVPIDTNINQTINIGSGTCTGTGANSSTLIIGNYSSDTTGTNTSTIHVGSTSTAYANQTISTIKGKLVSSSRDSITDVVTTRNISGYVDYISITAAATISDVGNNINLFVNIGGSGTVGFLLTIPSPTLMNGQYITFRSTRASDTTVKTASGNLIIKLGFNQAGATNGVQCLTLQSIALYSNGSFWIQIN